MKGAGRPAASPRLRRRVFEALEPGSSGEGLTLTNRLLAIAIIAASILAILETEPTILAANPGAIVAVELGFAVFFGLEYLARLWSAAENQALGGGWRARLRWMITPAALLDLAATLPVLLAPGLGPSYLLRLLRLARLIRFAKLGRFSRGWHVFMHVVASRRHELWAAASVGLMVLVASSSLLYLVEGGAQPDKFGSIPRALWWGVATLTTIGYGDVYPITPLGKALASVTAVVGIGLIAAPTGILAAGFAEELRKGGADPKP